MPEPHAALPLHALEDHYEELEFLWGQRQTALRSPAYTSADLAHLEARIEGQVQGLLAGGEPALSFLRARLTADHANRAFAAAYPLLRSDKKAESAAVLDAFLQAVGAARAGLCQALCHGASTALMRPLQYALFGSASPTGVAAARVLVFRWPDDLSPLPLGRSLACFDETPEVRRAAWQVAALRREPLNLVEYREGLADEDPRVRREVPWAAAWNGNREALEYCRLLAARPAPDIADVLRLLAILGTPTNLNAIRQAGRSLALGSQRFEALGAFGHPGVVDDLLEAMANPDVRTAVAAGRAFARITGLSVDSGERVPLPPEGGREPDEFEQEFLDEVHLPDAARARASWDGVRERFTAGTRWCRGFDLSHGAAEDVLAQLDRESLWEERLRARFEGRWAGRLADLEVFPQM